MLLSISNRALHTRNPVVLLKLIKLALLPMRALHSSDWGMAPNIQYVWKLSRVFTLVSSRHENTRAYRCTIRAQLWFHRSESKSRAAKAKRERMFPNPIKLCCKSKPCAFVDCSSPLPCCKVQLCQLDYLKKLSWWSWSWADLAGYELI